jgi:hypothetical protein
MEKRISIEDPELQPKPTSDKFKAKRAQHYNEMAAIKAFKERKQAQETGSESDRSDEEEEEQHELITTNTNTNINTTTSKAEVCRVKKLSVTSASDARASGNDRDVRGRAAVQIQPMPTQASCSSSGSRIAIKEEQQPKVSSDNFKAKRAQHYKEMAAVKAFKQQKKNGETSSESERSDDEATESEQKRVSISSDVPNAPGTVARETSKGAPLAAGPAVRIDSKAANPSPRSACSVPEKTEPGRSGAEDAAWRSKRNAHYSEMAAALRAAPPPSDDEDDEDQ